MKKKGPLSNRKYLRICDLMNRYGYSRGHIGNLIVAGKLPPPMVIGNVKSWPVEVIEILDRERKYEYYKIIKKQGFTVPEDV